VEHLAYNSQLSVMFKGDYRRSWTFRMKVKVLEKLDVPEEWY